MKNMIGQHHIEEGPNHFTVKAKGLNPVTVSLQPACFCVDFEAPASWRYNLRLRTPYKTGLCEFEKLQVDVATGMTAFAEPVQPCLLEAIKNAEPGDQVPAASTAHKPDERLPNTLHHEIKQGLSHSMEEQYDRLRAKAPADVIEVHKKVFESIGCIPDIIMSEGLYPEKELVEDLGKFRAAAHAAEEIRLLGYLAQYRRSLSKNGHAPRPSFYALGELQSGNEKVDWEPYVGDLKSLKSWRGLFSPNGEPYPILNETLMNLPEGISSFHLLHLGDIWLHRPMTDRLELLTLLSYLWNHAPDWSKDKTNVFAFSRADEIRQAIHLVGDYLQQPLSSKRTQDVKRAVDFMSYCPISDQVSIVEWADMAIVWHREKQSQKT